jgi:hypothetical protein
MKDNIKEIGNTLFDVAKFILILVVIYYLLGSCDNKNDDVEIGSLNVCGVELYMDDYYDNGIDWDKLSKDVDEECLQYYYENPKDICTDYIENNKEDLKADVCEE